MLPPASGYEWPFVVSNCVAPCLEDLLDCAHLHHEWVFTEGGDGREIADSIRRSWEATVVDPQAFSGYPVTAE